MFNPKDIIIKTLSHQYYSILHQWLVPASITIISLLLFANQTAALELFEFNRQLISEGQYWRLLTGNFLHTNGWHLVLNITGLLFLTLIFKQYCSVRAMIAFSLANSVAVGGLLYLFTPDIAYYVGLSGFLHGLFVVGCLAEISRGIKFSYLMLAVVTVKTIYEQMVGAPDNVRELIGANVAVDAHLYGALTAVPMFASYWLYKKMLNRD
ncbi:MAG: rhombosortase [Gammaproteobacteria bacterium]|nr:rhombosortase [Gammaproteobacteria bacterium]